MSRRQQESTKTDEASTNGTGQIQPQEPAPEQKSPKADVPTSILVIDIGGTKVKMLATGETKPRKAPTGRGFTPDKLVATVKKLAQGWKYDAITIGIPGPVGMLGPQTEPGNLGTGWVGYDFAAAFGVPVKIINDAVMQALGSYEHGRMFFMGLGTGVGSALIADNIIVPMEISHFSYDAERNLNEVLSRQAMQRYGKKVWRRAIEKVTTILMRAFMADYVVIGGGNAKYVKDLPVGARMGHNLTAFRGGIRIWDDDPHWIFAIPNGQKPLDAQQPLEAPVVHKRRRKKRAK